VIADLRDEAFLGRQVGELAGLPLNRASVAFRRKRAAAIQRLPDHRLVRDRWRRDEDGVQLLELQDIIIIVEALEARDPSEHIGDEPRIVAHRNYFELIERWRY
jgi:hypothetical protein